jgi:hypothetical protein
MDVADMHTSGRAIMRIIERDIRMAGFEYRDKDAKVTYGTISNPLTIKDSGNKCCDEVTVIYDYFDEDSKKAERIRIRYWAGLHTSNKGSRHRLYKQKDILGQNKKILAKPKLGNKEVMADYIEDLQIINIVRFSDLYIGTRGEMVFIYDPTTRKHVGEFYVNSARGKSYAADSLAYGDGLLYIGTRGEMVFIYDPTTRKHVGEFYVNSARGKSYAADSLAFKNKRTGKESLVTINLTLRTKNQYGKDRQFKKKDYHVGNYKLDKTDKYKRDTFSSTVLVRNLAL